jgi:hypothetical protein
MEVELQMSTLVDITLEEQSTGSIATFAFVYWHPLTYGFGMMKDHL